MKIYTYPSIWKTLLRLCVTAWITIFLVWIAAPLSIIPISTEYFVTFVVAGIALTFCVRELFLINKKWMVDHHSVRQVCRFQHKELRLKDIKGYRVRQDYIYLVSHKGKHMRISRYVGGFKTLMLWVASNYKDLDFQY
ncbi:hypothetical protein SAMN05421788_10827 [Filimonas lacunae]|uniref:Uncharacterized protein n=1 Tax=Filimonas lacunae TaxID=477680 RepID=A0A1N7R158_9BACT|nr:hypothetical protein [Filimonas lacunae]SIT28437.1 hypothetical protein SAMN05421788_10827 [Filimonas lacunae]